MSKQVNNFKKTSPIAHARARNIRTPPGFSRQGSSNSIQQPATNLAPDKYLHNDSSVQDSLSAAGLKQNNSNDSSRFLSSGLTRTYPYWAPSPRDFNNVKQEAPPATPKHAFWDVPSPEPPASRSKNGDAYPKTQLVAVHEFDTEAPPAFLDCNPHPMLTPSDIQPKLGSSLRKQSKLTKEMIARLTKEKQELESALKSSTQTKEEAVAREAKLQLELNSMCQSKIEMVDQVKTMEDTIKHKSDEIVTLRTQIALQQHANDTKVGALEQRNETLSTEKRALANELEQQRRVHESTVNSLDAEKTELTRQVKNLQADKKQMKVDHKAKISDLEDDKKCLIDHAQRLQNDSAKIQTERNKLEIERNILARVNDGYKGRVESLESEKAKLEGKVEELERINTEHGGKNSSLVSMIAELQDEITVSKETIVLLAAEKNELTGKAVELEAANNASLETMSSLLAENTELQAAIKKHESEKEDWMDQIHKLNIALNDKSEECNKLKSRVRRFEFGHSLGSQTLPLPDEIRNSNDMHLSGTPDNPINLDDSFSVEKENDKPGRKLELSSIDISAAHSKSFAKPVNDDVSNLEILPRDQWQTAVCKIKGCTKRQQSGKDNMCSRHYTMFKKAGVGTKGSVSKLVTTDAKAKSGHQAEILGSHSTRKAKVTCTTDEEGRKQVKRKRALRELEGHLLSPIKTRSRGRIRPKRGIDH